MTAVVQYKGGNWITGGGTITRTFTVAPSAGNTLVAFSYTEGNPADVPTITTAGWTRRESLALTNPASTVELWTAAGTAGSSVTTSNASAGNHQLVVYEIDEPLDVTAQLLHAGTFPPSGSGTLTGPDITPAGDTGILLVGLIGANQSYIATPTFTADSPLVADAAAQDAGGRTVSWTAHRTTTTGTYTPSATVSGLTGNYQYGGVAIILGHTAPASPVADFVGEYSGRAVAPLTVTFTDLSTKSPTSWAWTFGDGGTDTVQNPVHVYTVAGTYEVCLTATNASGSDQECKAAYIRVLASATEEPIPPASALVEIYASEPGSARWDEAHWGDDVWSTAGWQDVTPYSVSALIRWGSNRPELGILSQPDAGSWGLDLYDPDRVLDPANTETPYYGDLIPGLPIRITHRSKVIRTGHVEAIMHSFERSRGYVRATDAQAKMVQARVPDDTTLSDTLYARARDAIAAAGLSIEVLPDPSSGDPALVAWVTGTDRSAWQWIADAAQQVLHIPYIDAIGRLGFRAWASPLVRGRTLAAPELVDLQAIAQYDGQFSVVQATDDTLPTAVVVERALTPPPAYGRVVYARTDPTPNAGDWAQAVLEDRALPALRWVPGQMFPSTAAMVETLADIEAVEQVGISHIYTDPQILTDAIVVGGSIRLEALRDNAARWWFTFEAAETPLTPLARDGASPVEFLFTEAGDEYVYPG